MMLDSMSLWVKTEQKEPGRNFAGVMYTLINQLYYRSVLPDPVLAALHALRQCSNDNSSCRSVFYALILDSEESGEESFTKSYNSEMMPFPKGFL